jgi:hypothetical protein
MFCYTSIAQTTGKIKTVSKDGLYVMKIPSLIRSYSKNDLSGLRIFDQKNQEIPYFIYENNENISTNNFEKLEIISKNIKNKSKSEIVFKNSPAASTEFIVEFANTLADKYFEISGSNDQTNWYGLVQKQYITLGKSTDNTSFYVPFEIPYNNYQYLKLTFYDELSLPVNVLNVGVIKSKIIEKGLESLKPQKIKIIQDKLNKTSLIHVIFNQKEVINQVCLTISNPKLYHRAATVYCHKKAIVKRKTIIEKNIVSSFDLKPTQKNSFIIPETFSNELFIAIDNQDNLPLTIDNVSFFQYQKFLIAELKAQEKYNIITSFDSISSPNYYLKYFEESIPKKLPETQIIDVIAQKVNIDHQKKSTSKNWILWICIGVAALVAIYFVMGLLKDMNQDK